MGFDFVWILQSLPAVIIGLTVHEFAHAYTAFKLGDVTAKQQGRISLNPLKHLDPLGTFLIVVLGFGWAKPVMFNPDNLKNKHRDEILISLAGPFSNLLLGILFLVIVRVLFNFDAFSDTEFGHDTLNLLVMWSVINFGLFIFNLLPIPPLDGSHIYTTFLHKINPAITQRIYQFGMYALIVIFLIQNNTKIQILPIAALINGITAFCFKLLGFHA